MRHLPRSRRQVYALIKKIAAGHSYESIRPRERLGQYFLEHNRFAKFRSQLSRVLGIRISGREITQESTVEELVQYILKHSEIERELSRNRRRFSEDGELAEAESAEIGESDGTSDLALEDELDLFGSFGDVREAYPSTYEQSSKQPATEIAGLETDEGISDEEEAEALSQDAQTEPPTEPADVSESIERPSLLLRKPSLSKDQVLTVGSDDGPTSDIEDGDSPDESPPTETSTSGGGEDPPRSAYALLDCPEEVEPSKEFSVTVGLSKNPSSGVVGKRMYRPKGSVGDYKLRISLLYDGFDLRDGESSELVLHVTAENPYPKKEVHLTAIAAVEFKNTRTLMAQYSVDGQYMGAAARPIAVKTKEEVAKSFDHKDRFDLSMPPGVPTPDITISITRGNRTKDDRLLWNVITPHEQINVARPNDQERSQSNIGDAPAEWARKMMNSVNSSPETNRLGNLMYGYGRQICRQIPVWVQRSLRDLYLSFQQNEGKRPTLFIISDEPHIPWELAYLKLGEKDNKEEFLGAVFVVGRWVHGYEDIDGNRVPAYPPPVEVTIDSVAVVSGDYSQTKHWNALAGAAQEAAHLVDQYKAIRINADSGLADWLAGNPNIGAIHFAVHGKLGSGLAQDGIVLVDGTYLSSEEVLGITLENRPFVFLNACQLGQGEDSLGDYAGIAAAFLEAGACGVVAALWNVDDKEAKDLALEFYRVASSGSVDPGEIFRQRRSDFQGEKISKTPLAYQFFGHPHMRMTLN